MNSLVAVAVFGLVAMVFAAPITEDCKTLAAPNKVTSEQSANKSTVLLEYPMNKVRIVYYCPGKGEDDDGIFQIFADAKGNQSNLGESIDMKEYILTPVPGMNGTLFVNQVIPEMKSEIIIRMDDDGFEIIGICYKEYENGTPKDGSSTPWTKDTPTDAAFPFTYTDAGTLRYQMSKCSDTNKVQPQ